MSLSSHIALWFAYLTSLYFIIFWFITFWENRENFKSEELQEQKPLLYPFVSILIPAYNEETHIVGTLNSVLDLNYPNDKIEIIVINDGSTDNTKQKINKIINTNKNRKIILLDQTNQGKAQSLNNALKIAKGEFFACLDADSYVEKETLMKMIHTYEYENDPNLVIVTPAMKVNKPKTILQKLQRLEYLTMIFLSRMMSRINCLYVAPGPFSLYRTKIIKKLGCFDKNSLTEDQEIAYRAQKYHYSLKHCYNAYVYTSSPPTFKKLSKQRNRWYKGSFFNLLKYKSLIWNKEYGDFGFFQMTNNIAIFVLGAITILAFSYYAIWPLIKLFYKLAIVNFDIMPYLKTITFNYTWLDVNMVLVMVLGLIFVLAASILYISHKNAKEKIKANNIPYILLYFLVYYLVLCFIELIVFVELAIKKKQKW